MYDNQNDVSTLADSTLHFHAVMTFFLVYFIAQVQRVQAIIDWISEITCIEQARLKIHPTLTTEVTGGFLEVSSLPFVDYCYFFYSWCGK